MGRSSNHQAPNNTPPPWTPEEDAKLLELWPVKTMSIRDIRRELKRSDDQISRRAKFLGLPPRGTWRKGQQFMKRPEPEPKAPVIRLNVDQRTLPYLPSEIAVMSADELKLAMSLGLIRLDLWDMLKPDVATVAVTTNL